jgi:protein TonB
MQTLSYPVPQKAKLSLPIIAAVGLFHLVVIYAVLVAIDVVPAPLPPHPSIFHIFQTQKIIPPKPTLPNPVVPTKFAPESVPVPKIPVDTGDHQAPITVPRDTGPVTATPLTLAATAIGSTHTIPLYPPFDRRLGHEGAVRLTLTIDAQGNVSDAAIAQSSGYDGLDQAAIAWVKAHWRYHPAMRDGKAVAATTQAEVTFKLTQG